jgi:hypothetical protein
VRLPCSLVDGFQVVAEEDAAHHRDPEERVRRQLVFFWCASRQSIFALLWEPDGGQ